MRLLQTIALACALFLPGAASAATVLSFDQTVTISGGAGGGLNFTETGFAFNGFNQPGTLTSVTLTVDVNASGNVSADFCAFFGDCEPATASLTLTGSGPAFAGVFGTAADGAGINNSTNALQTGTYDVSLTQAFASLVAADFIGAGPVSGGLALVGDYDGFTFNGGNAYTYGGTATLTYTYEISTVPLPAGLPLLAIGLGALCAIGRRARRSA